MKLEDLNIEYDKLQKKYGAKELHSIYNGGCSNNPDICFVFIGGGQKYSVVEDFCNAPENTKLLLIE